MEDKLIEVPKETAVDVLKQILAVQQQILTQQGILLGALVTGLTTNGKGA